MQKHDTKPDFKIESLAGIPVVGIDESGRGSLIGPVFAAAVHFPMASYDDILNASFLIDDSKKLNPSIRSQSSYAIKTLCTFGLGVASVEEIEEINILQATLLAMRRAYSACIEACIDKDLVKGDCLAIVDGDKNPFNNTSLLSYIELYKPPQLVQTHIGGDAKSLTIAAASIIAKVERDNYISNVLHPKHPEYAWDSNKGYCTKQHVEAIKKYGPTPLHRKKFISKFV